MPAYRVVTRIINEWEHVFTAANEQEALDMAYKESEPDIGPDDYVEQDAVELWEENE